MQLRLKHIYGLDRRGTAALSPFRVLVGFLVLLLLTGGSSRADEMTLVVLRPLSFLVLGYAAYTLRADQARAYRFLLWMAALIVALPVLHLTPLPPVIWGALPGRDLVAEIDRAAGLEGLWRPLTLHPAGTWNALWSLAVPLAVLLLAIQLNRAELRRLLIVVMALILASGLWSIVQMMTGLSGPAGLYRFTEGAAPAGFFGNRNHQAFALACLFPMLAAWLAGMVGNRPASPSRGKAIKGLDTPTVMAALVALLLVPLLLVSGSRGGLLVAILGMVSMPFILLRGGRKDLQFTRLVWLAVGACAVLALGLLTVYFSRALAIDRLFSDSQAEIRPAIAAATWQVAQHYAPVGAGMGSYVPVFMADEPYALLGPTYTNHAHNDWLELAQDGGVPALLLLLVVIGAVIRGFARQVMARSGDHNDPLRAAALSMFVLLALACTVDYPAHVPIVMAVMTIAAVWAAMPVAASQHNDGESAGKQPPIELA